MEAQVTTEEDKLAEQEKLAEMNWARMNAAVASGADHFTILVDFEGHEQIVRISRSPEESMAILKAP